MSDILCLCFSVSAALDAGEERETDSDLMLAQMLQMQFDKEFDSQLRTEEKKLNGDSKRKPMNKSGIRTIQRLFSLDNEWNKTDCNRERTPGPLILVFRIKTFFKCFVP